MLSDRNVRHLRFEAVPTCFSSRPLAHLLSRPGRVLAPGTFPLNWDTLHTRFAEFCFCTTCTRIAGPHSQKNLALRSPATSSLSPTRQPAREGTREHPKRHGGRVKPTILIPTKPLTGAQRRRKREGTGGYPVPLQQPESCLYFLSTPPRHRPKNTSPTGSLRGHKRPCRCQSGVAPS